MGGRRRREQQELSSRPVDDCGRSSQTGVRGVEDVLSELGDRVDGARVVVEANMDVVEVSETAARRGFQTARRVSAVATAEDLPEPLAADPVRTALVAEQEAVAADDPRLAGLAASTGTRPRCPP